MSSLKSLESILVTLQSLLSKNKSQCQFSYLITIILNQTIIPNISKNHLCRVFGKQFFSDDTIHSTLWTNQVQFCIQAWNSLGFSMIASVLCLLKKNIRISKLYLFSTIDLYAQDWPPWLPPYLPILQGEWQNT